MKMPLLALLLLCGVLVPVSAGEAATGLTLAQDGNTQYVIVVGDDALASEQTAAEQLKKYLDRVTGADFSIVSALLEAEEQRLKIHVGPSEAAKQAAGEVDWEALGTDGIVIRTSEQDLVLAGGRPRGTLYAVYTFLQDVVGCRWYAADAEEVIPSRPTLEISKQDTVYRPPFDFRLPYTSAIEDPAFRVKSRVNGELFMESIPEELGGGINMGLLPGGAHTMLHLLPPAKYFEEHPEWFAFRQSEGERVPSQLCLTHPGAREALSQAVLKLLEDIYAEWQYPPKIVPVSPEYNPRACQCEACLAVVEREGAESGPLLEMVNHVAEWVEEKYPDVLILTLPYWHTERPPQHLKPRRQRAGSVWHAGPQS